jgi:hypothetical protein
MRNGRFRTLLPVIVVAGAAGSSVPPASGTPSASAARSLSVRDEGYLGFRSSSGSELIDEGHAKGTLPGWVKVRFTYNGSPAVYAQFTISTHDGLIKGHATGRLNNPNSTGPSFRGSLSITSGTGRYARVTGNGELFGVFYRRSYALTVQAIGNLRY